MGIEIKTVGELIDSLITTSLRCWFAQESLMNASLSEHERLEAAVKAQTTNAKRNQLIKAINELLGQQDFSDKKSYDK